MAEKKVKPQSTTTAASTTSHDRMVVASPAVPPRCAGKATRERKRAREPSRWPANVTRFVALTVPGPQPGLGHRVGFDLEKRLTVVVLVARQIDAQLREAVYRG